MMKDRGRDRDQCRDKECAPGGGRMKGRAGRREGERKGGGEGGRGETGEVSIGWAISHHSPDG